ncbi:hypothetical protein RHGRI_034662 [Rhododendron griersonianum]|uniref:Uncharacterized protein n=1 Tax=Rhododendron griersonianum TaxID=479676 RepID=A0AAV6I2D4_9ERIC|nr:hypothetical protein RHGRI_034662 [Rhododendron griersonianum]
MHHLPLITPIADLKVATLASGKNQSELDQEPFWFSFEGIQPLRLTRVFTYQYPGGMPNASETKPCAVPTNHDSDHEHLLLTVSSSSAQKCYYSLFVVTCFALVVTDVVASNKVLFDDKPLIPLAVQG